MDFSTASVEKSLAQLAAKRQGLSSTEASLRLKKYGLNELKNRQPWQVIKKIASPFASAFVIILAVGGLISWISGNFADAYIILAVITINAVIEWAQQLSASKVLASLKGYSAKLVKVRRDGKVSEINSSLLMPGDIMLLAEGEKIAADGRILESNELSIDESGLTGESVSVAKNANPLPGSKPIYQQTNMVFAGTVTQTGRAEVCVTATGNQTQLGKIAKLAASSEDSPPIVKKIRALTFRLVLGTLAIAALTLALGLIQGIAPTEMLRFSVALIVSVIPEGLPVTLTIILLLGIQRMAKKKALVRNLQAVETLGMVTAVATDKTGTLTKNQMGIAAYWDLDGSLSSQDNTDFWLSVSHRHPDLAHPIEKIITQSTEQHKAPPSWKEVADLPFDNRRRFTVVAWRSNKTYRIYIKGAAEVILAACKIDAATRRKVNDQLKRMSSSNMRVVAVAQKSLRQLPKDLTKYTYSGFSFEGLIGFSDELRPEASAAIKATRQAGIKVYMLTGDHSQTAATIAQDLGLIDTADQVVEGSVLQKHTLGQLQTLLGKTRAFARVLPEHKFRLLEALKQSQITGMTGDGVNDAPALAKADVGIAMGSGTDAAKEAADIVLLDDNYSTIVEAIKEGRRIYANVRKMIFYQLSTNLAEALVVVGGLMLGLPLTMTAAQILWLNLITDTTMIIPLGLEHAEAGQMKTPPRKPRESLLSNHLLGRLVLTVLVMAGCSLVAFKLFLGESVELARTMAFLTLCSVQWAAAFNSRSETMSVLKSARYPNHKIWAGIAVGAVLIALAIYGPLQQYMGTVPISFSEAWIFIPAILVTILASDLHKKMSAKKP